MEVSERTCRSGAADNCLSRLIHISRQIGLNDQYLSVEVISTMNNDNLSENWNVVCQVRTRSVTALVDDAIGGEGCVDFFSLGSETTTDSIDQETGELHVKLVS